MFHQIYCINIMQDIDHQATKRGLQHIHYVRWMFILSNRPSAQQRAKINKFMYAQQGLENNIGTNFEDYVHLMQRISQTNQNIGVYLVVDLPNYLTIFSEQMRKKYPHYVQCINQVFLFPFQKGDGFQIQKIRKTNKLIDKNFCNFESFISQNQKVILKDPCNKSQLSNFNILGMDQSERKSKQRRMKIYACIKLQEKYYEEYMEKFTKVLQKQAVLNILDKFVLSQLAESVKLLTNKKTKEFYLKIFALYKRQTRFYYVVNSSIKRFCESGFDWSSYALPISLLFRAIKLYFNDPSNRGQIQKLFDKNGECTLWRAAKFSNNEQKDMQKIRAKKNIFYEHVSFTSTSLSKEVAMFFLDPNDLENYCLIKYTVKKPSFQQQIDRLDFVFLSFAHLFGKDSENNQQMEILLNSLAICELKDTKAIKVSQMKKINEKFYKKFATVYERFDVPIFEMDVYNNFIQSHLPSKQNRLQAKQMPKYLRNYLSTIDIIKSSKTFDIGHAFQYSGCLQQAVSHFQGLLKQQREKQQKDPKHMYYLQSCIVQVLQKMDNNEDALAHVRNAIEICKLIEKQEVNTTKKQHQQLLFKMVQKSGYLLQTNYFYNEAVDQVTQYIQVLKHKGNQNKKQKLAFQFQRAEYLMMRAIIHFRQGNIVKAQEDIKQSRAIVQDIMKKIEYQNIKKETFYLDFIFHFFIDQQVQWDSDQYFKKRRMQNIVQATIVFGGQEKLLRVLNSSKSLSDQISQFIQTRKRQIQQQKMRQKLQQQRMGQNIKKPQQERKDHKIIISEIEQQFKNHSSTKKIQGQLQNFFLYFNQIVANKDYEADSLIKEREQRMLNILIDTIPSEFSLQNLKKSEEDLIKLQQSINTCKINDWNSLSSLNQNWLQLQLKYDELIQLKKQQNSRIIQSYYNKVGRQNFRDYCKQNIASINQIKAKYEEQGYPLPERFQFKLNSFQAKLHGDLGNQQEQKKIFDKIINNTISDTNLKALNLISTFLLRIRLYFTQTQIDFQHQLLHRTQQKMVQTRDWQKKQIKECKIIMQELKLQIAFFQQKNSWLKNEGKNKIKALFMQKHIQAMLCMVRLAVFEIFLINDSSNKAKALKPLQSKSIQKQFQNILYQIYGCIDQQAKRQELLGQYHQINSFYLFMLGEYDLSLKNIEKGISFLQKKDTIKHIKLFVKLFFMFADRKDIDLTKYTSRLNDLKKNYQAFPSYWRVCLAYHFNYRFIRSTKVSINKCISILQKILGQKIKLQLIQDCELKMYMSYISAKQLSEGQADSNLENPQKESNSSHVHLSTFELFKRNKEFYDKNVAIRLPNTEKLNAIISFKGSPSLNLIRKPQSEHQKSQITHRLSIISKHSTP